MSKKRVKELEELIIYHKQKYYKGDAEVSDLEYDSIEDELKSLSPDSYALKLVGFEVIDDKIEHASPMLSLNKSREPSDIVDWMDGEECIIADKMDGSSASLVYQKGVFQLAKSRGDGAFGENLTKYFKYIKVPKIFKKAPLKNSSIEIRGEVCISKKNFEKLSIEMEKRELEKPKSIRNIVAGLLHKKRDLDLCNYLDFIGYEIITSDFQLKSEKDKLTILKNEGFLIPGYTIINSAAELNDSINNYSETISENHYLTDGLVISVNDLEIQIGRGFTGHHPKGKIAFKFKSDSAVTKVKDIIIDVGRTGKLTFVGVVEPVELSGATVQKVSFHNVKYIKENNLNIGCEIQITRSGEVIPKHEKTITENGEFQFPENCIICNEKLDLNETGIDLVCNNNNCKARIYGRISNWINVNGIENIGDGTLEKLYNENLVTRIEDLYKLKIEDMANLEKLGEKSSKKIIANILKSKDSNLITFLSGLGIDGLGSGVSKLIAKRFPNIEELKKGTINDFLEIKGIGEILAKNIYEGLNSFGWQLYSRLDGIGFKIACETSGDTLNDESKKFNNKSFVITGKLSKPRKEIEKFIEVNGGKSSKTISKNTSFLVCNEKSNSSKYLKAEKLGIEIISEESLFKL